MRIQEIWQWIVKEISKAGVGLLHEALGGLIEEFQAIWDSLGLPSLPALLDIDIESLIATTIDQVKSLYDSSIQLLQNELRDLTEKLKQGLADIQEIINKADELSSLIKEKWTAIVDGILNIQIFSIKLSDIVNLPLSMSFDSIEEKIQYLIAQAKDWAYKFPLKIITDWMETVKSFFEAIGLNDIIEFLTFTFCDFLNLIGLPHTETLP